LIHFITQTFTLHPEKLDANLVPRLWNAILQYGIRGNKFVIKNIFSLLNTKHNLKIITTYASDIKNIIHTSLTFLGDNAILLAKENKKVKLNTSLNHPPGNLPTPPLKTPPLKTPPLKPPPKNLPPINLPPVNLPPNLPPVNLPPVNFPPVNLPPVNLPRLPSSPSKKNLEKLQYQVYYQNKIEVPESNYSYGNAPLRSIILQLQKLIIISSYEVSLLCLNALAKIAFTADIQVKVLLLSYFYGLITDMNSFLRLETIPIINILKQIFAAYDEQLKGGNISTKKENILYQVLMYCPNLPNDFDPIQGSTL